MNWLELPQSFADVIYFRYANYNKHDNHFIKEPMCKNVRILYEDCEIDVFYYFFINFFCDIFYVVDFNNFSLTLSFFLYHQINRLLHAFFNERFCYGKNRQGISVLRLFIQFFSLLFCLEGY